MIRNGLPANRARERIREALQAWFDLPNPYAGTIDDDVRLPAAVKRAVRTANDARKRALKANEEASRATRVALTAVADLGLSLRDAGAGSGNVLPMPPAEDWAERFRSHLKRAGVDRAALFADDDTHKQITLYDLRATGITWRCLRKDYGSEIQQAAGHEKYDTTDGYIRTAGVFVGRIGEPCPALPQTLLTPQSDHDFGSRRGVRSSFEPNSASMLASPTGFERLLNSGNLKKSVLLEVKLVA